ncbi:MAG: serine hydroxymethyltransferase [Nitrososphaerales archaeon]|nr:serine hydroxymethyltransferase [Nitrososphaerales archaeon]
MHVGDSPEDYYNRIFQLLEAHHNWFKSCIPLIASENVPSAAVREALMSDFGDRYAEGWPGERVYAGCIYIDQVELLCIELAKKLFRAEFADVRPVSGVCANLSIYTAFTQPNDRMLALSIPNGGHISMGKKDFYGTAGAVHGLRVEYFAFNRDEMNIDVDQTKKIVERMAKEEHDPPKMAMFGGSLFLFPHPVKELADFFHSYNMFICYDSAHVSGLIAGGKFQDPLREGADALTLSTHKTIFGPQGGAIVSFEKYSEQIKKAVFPANTSNHHLHSVAAKAVAFAEMLKFGKEYAEQVIRNAKALAQALHERGFKVLGEKKGFTESHQVALNIVDYGGGGVLEKELERANIIVNRQLLPGDIQAGRHYTNPGGLRLGSQEVTRLGMKESDMEEIAEFIKRVIIDKEPPERVKKDVIEFRKNFQKIHYAFDTALDAYEYVRIRK